jgi:hypothetical protein
MARGSEFVAMVRDASLMRRSSPSGFETPVFAKAKTGSSG